MFHRRFLSVLLLLLAVLTCLVGCSYQTDIPFNGDVAFHEIAVTIPEDYIRDSTQSTDDMWIFEKGYYSQYVMLMRTELTRDAGASLDSYAAYLRGQGVASARTVFLGQEAVRSSAEQDGVLWQELLFAHGSATYAIALRGGTEADFEAIVQTVCINGAAASEPALAAPAE